MAGKLLIGLEDVHLSYGGKPLFAGVNLFINEGDKICLVGKNGAGKTTIMKLITDELDSDAGSRFELPNTTIGYLAQKVDFLPNETVKEFVLKGLPVGADWEDKQHLADIIIEPLELDPDAQMKTLSGGQLRRAALASALIAETDLLLLDEPTNHLDLSAIEWLEQYLAGYKGAVICVSHDRTFLENISKKVFWIDRGIIRTCPFGYAQFDDWAEKIIENEARALQNLQKKLDAEIDWTQGGVTGRRKRNVRRLSELARLREKIVADKAAYRKATETIEADALSTTLSSKRVVEFKNVSKSFTRDGKKLHILNEFNLTVLRGDRIGILGRNGSGKSTFLKMLIGELQPDEGLIRRAKTIDISYFDQNRTDLQQDETLWGTLCPEGGDYVFLGSGPKAKSKHVCGYLKDFLFDPKMAKDRVSTLSGGQQNRLLLAKILSCPGNLLILDEPTNDLDMDTLDMLQGLIADYPGTLIIVSHDRDFLDRTVTEVLAFEGNGVVKSYAGGYSDYLEAKQIEEGKILAKKKPTPQQPIAERKPEPIKLSNKIKYELEKLPQKIESLENEISELSHLLADSELYYNDPAQFDKATSRYSKAKDELEAAETRWLELEELRNQAEAG